MSSTGSIAEHPVVTGLRTAAGALDPAALELGWQLDDDDVETAIATVLDLESRAAAYRAMLLREAETRDLKKRTKALTLARWLSDRFRLSRVDAGARVRAAEGIGRHAVVQSALATGAVTTDQAEVLAQVLDTVAAMPGVGGRRPGGGGPVPGRPVRDAGAPRPRARREGAGRSAHRDPVGGRPGRRGRAGARTGPGRSRSPGDGSATS